VAERFPKNWSVRYNLACYYAQLMEFDAAQEWFKAAMELNEMPVKRMAVDDLVWNRCGKRCGTPLGSGADWLSSLAHCQSECKLPSLHLMQPADAKANQPQRTMNQLLAA